MVQTDERVAERAGPDGTVDFRTAPQTYRHWRLDVDGKVATLWLDVAEHGGLRPGYELKLNSYDLGVDIELYDAMQRLRFEHPGVRAVVLTSAKDRIFCAGANILMLADASHHWKVNFCKFTNETRNAIEDASARSGQTYLAALNGTASGGGYELALACDHVMLVDDRSSVVSLPELPLLGVLPGTGGLTRLVDKRMVRRDLADWFATRAEGVGGRRAEQIGLVDEVVPRSEWDAAVRRRAEQLADRSSRPGGPGCTLDPLAKDRSAEHITYRFVTARLDRVARVAEIALAGPDTDAPADLDALHAAGCTSWTLALTRELDDLVLDLRTNEPEIGTWVLRSHGDPDRVLAHDRFLLDHRGDWLAHEIVLYLARTLRRLDVTSRSLVALVEPGSCFAGSLLEVVLAADRSFHLGVEEPLDGDDGTDPPATIELGPANLGPLPMSNGLTRLQSRFWGHDDERAGAEAAGGRALRAGEAVGLGLVTFAPDDLDWDDEVRIALEERSSFSPDALTGLEANLRFVGPETIETKIFGRLTAWQNWIFSRPNASGPDGALRNYGTGRRADYDRKRV